MYNVVHIFKIIISVLIILCGMILYVRSMFLQQPTEAHSTGFRV